MTSGNGRRLAILGFHRIGDPPPEWPSWFYVPAATFERFLDELRTGRWHAIDLPTFLRGLAHPATLPERAALITFDDGSPSVLERALPRLHAYGDPAVLFMPTNFIGRENRFDAGVEPAETLCDWQQLRALERGGVSIQSHTASHRRLSQLTPSERLDELVRSKATLERRLGHAVDVVAYPYGDDAGADAARAAGYRAAFLYGGGPIRLPPADRYRLARVAMGPDTDLTAVLEDGR